MSRRSFVGIIESLRSGVSKLKWNPEGTEWADYYSDTNYSKTAFEHKKQIVKKFLEEIKPDSVWDLGANTGEFSRLASEMSINTISFDIDPAAVEKNYLKSIEKKEKTLLPLILDLTNPSPNIGWSNKERKSILERGPVDTVLALALIHHLAISNNLPLTKIVEFFKTICKHLIIEFIPKTDSQVKRLLSTREDIFDDYTLEKFEEEFMKEFSVKEKINLDESGRIIYCMEKKFEKSSEIKK